MLYTEAFVFFLFLLPLKESSIAVKALKKTKSQKRYVTINYVEFLIKLNTSTINQIDLRLVNWFKQSDLLNISCALDTLRKIRKMLVFENFNESLIVTLSIYRKVIREILL